MELARRVSVVTGAAGGIGAATARSLLARGSRVVVSDVDAARLRATAAELAAEFSDTDVAAVVADAAADEGIGAMIAAAESAWGPVDLYVANAGVGDGRGLAAGEEHWRLALEVNLLAHVRAARRLVPGWLERGEGYFASTASAAGLLTQIGSATYSVSKAGAVAFAEWLAVTYGHHGVGVSCLCPMGVDTDLLRSGMGPDAGGRAAAAAVTGAGEVLDPAVVAEQLLDAVERGDFLVLPHPEVHEFLRRKSADPQRWIRGMQRYAGSLEEQERAEEDKRWSQYRR